MIKANQNIKPDVQVMYVGTGEREPDEIGFGTRWLCTGTVVGLSNGGEIAHVVWGDPLYYASWLLAVDLMACP